MSWHENKRILVGVCGGIAAYKSAILVRRLVAGGADVRVMMTRAAQEFITPLTLQAVSGHPVCVDALEAESGMGHIELARWAEVVVIAPATANCLARLAAGLADDLVSAVVLAVGAVGAVGEDVEVVVAPAMNAKMWGHQATQANVATLAGRGVRVIAPDSGEQACGETGAGRMREAEEIAGLVMGEGGLEEGEREGGGGRRALEGVGAVVTAGPTWEAVDPVRGMTNRSSGKMGFAMARALRDFGAGVVLVSGPVGLETPRGVRRVEVESGEEMLGAVREALAEEEGEGARLFVGVAAVADYRAAEVAGQKMKKGGEEMTLRLVQNADILAEVAGMGDAPFTVGFAAETEDVVGNARRKLVEKGVDMMVANAVGGEAGIGVFGGEENAGTLLYREGAGEGIGEVELARMDKYRLAVRVVEEIARRMQGGRG